MYTKIYRCMIYTNVCHRKEKWEKVALECLYKITKHIVCVLN